MQSCFLSAEFPDWSQIGSGESDEQVESLTAPLTFSLLINQDLLYMQREKKKKLN